jgi:hypothetical protein
VLINTYHIIKKPPVFLAENKLMQKTFLGIVGLISILTVSAQNLVVNPGGQSLPRGTGWTVLSAGGTACAVAPTNTYLSWTMIPDGSAGLYPYDHTTGAAGGVTFFSGCSVANRGPFELYQDIDVSADAVNIDLGIIQYTFSGYIQTPVNNIPGGQTDQGRFIVDYLDVANVIIGSSYTSSWQSNALGSGAAWNLYNNTRVAPSGTRTVRVRLQTQVFTNTPAINAYFDDIALVKATVLPVTLISFTGTENDGKIYLSWKVADEINLANYQLQQSTDGINFNNIATITAGKKEYSFIDRNTSNYIDKYYYRLRMVDIDGKFSYSDVLPIKIRGKHSITISPNPAKDFVTLSGFESQGKITIINGSGASVYTGNTLTQGMKINIAHLPAGLYVVRFTDGKAVSYKKLLVQHY